VPRSPIGIVVGCKYFKKWRTVRATFTLRSAETRSLFYDSIKAKKSLFAGPGGVTSMRHSGIARFIK
jgi:hypothetical protein